MRINSTVGSRTRRSSDRPRLARPEAPLPRPVPTVLMMIAASGCRAADPTVRRADAGEGPSGTPAGEGDADSDADTDSDADADSDSDGGTAPCPSDAAWVAGTCMDRYEAPNREGTPPLVMYTLDEAEDWCAARGKRLCTDAEWELACAGAGGRAWPYGDDHEPGRCNDEEIWRVYSQDRLNGWPSSASSTAIESLPELLDAARAAGASGAGAAAEIEELYQGESAGENQECTSGNGVFDLVGNVEEWTLRADGGSAGYSGNLKGRYWAEARDCQSDVTTHADAFRFYEIGFRCCAGSG